MTAVRIEHGDCRAVVATLADASVDAVVTDPPYALVSIAKRFGSATAAPAKGDVYTRAAAGFMGKRWDTGEVAFNPAFWADVLRILKPGGHVVAFGGTRTYHRLAVAIEDAGFEIRDQIGWLYGSGFPKSHDVSKGIDRAAGAQREVIGVRDADRKPNGNFGIAVPQSTSAGVPITMPATAEAVAWQGWGTALKPAWEPIMLARKPLIGTVAENVLAYATGALNIDGCRVPSLGGAPRQDEPSQDRRYADRGSTNFAATPGPRGGDPTGRWPANIVHDGSDEVVAAFPQSESRRAVVTSKPGAVSVNGAGLPSHTGEYGFNDSGSAARFFYSAKADSDDRLGSKHPTVKPVDLMAWLCRLITPPGGTVLDPFAGSGSTGMACLREGFDAILIEREADYVADIRRRLAHVEGGDTPLFTGVAQ